MSSILYPIRKETLIRLVVPMKRNFPSPPSGIIARFTKRDWFPFDKAVIKMSENGSMEGSIISSCTKLVLFVSNCRRELPWSALLSKLFLGYKRLTISFHSSEKLWLRKDNYVGRRCRKMLKGYSWRWRKCKRREPDAARKGDDELC